jgi:hypothetical protein
VNSYDRLKAEIGEKLSAVLEAMGGKAPGVTGKSVTFTFQNSGEKKVSEETSKGLFSGFKIPDQFKSMADGAMKSIGLRITFPKQAVGSVNSKSEDGVSTKYVKFEDPSKTIVFDITKSNSFLVNTAIGSSRFAPIIGKTGISALQIDKKGRIVIELTPVDPETGKWKTGKKVKPVEIKLEKLDDAVGFWKGVHGQS